MKVIKLEEGKVEYKVPNVAEAMMLLGEMGFSVKDLESMADEKGAVKDTYFLGQLLNKMDKFVTNIDLKVEEEEIKDYDKLLTYPEFLSSILIPIATDIMGAMGTDSKKKKSSKKRVR